MKRRPGESEKRLVTAAQAKEIEAEWSRQSSRQIYYRYVSPFGVTEEEFSKLCSDLSKTNGPDSADWSAAYTYCQMLLQASTDHQERKILYHTLARLGADKEQPFYELLLESHREELLRYKEMPDSVVGVRVEGAGDERPVCDACSAEIGISYTINEALEKMPLPPRGCSCGPAGRYHGWSNCRYSPVLASDTM